MGQVLTCSLGVLSLFPDQTLTNFDFSYYPWHESPEGSTIVDVGGAVGSAVALVLPLTPKDTKFVTQELSPSVLEKAKAFWNERDPNLIPNGRVVLQRHDFFQPQPIKGAEVYFMRFVLHDWKEDLCVEILKRLHDAASSNSRLLIVEAVVAHACHDIGALRDGAVEGAYPNPMPHPLPANGGRAAEFEAGFDMHMLNLLYGVERTYEQYRRVADKAGWKPTKVYRTDELSSLKILEFVKM
ncbi:hypothetical protein FRB90_007954 [Tulasnella sp. 427]|nr:hypothetical protein FRB90_007954 [Tulasnella sp. 427]